MNTRNMILVVDDQATNRMLLCKAFQDDYTIAQAQNGREAIYKIWSHKHDLAAILLDLIMPDLNGFEVLEIMRKEKIQVPVFLVTADTSEEVMRKGYELGVMDVIQKPIIPYFVRKRVNNVVELYQAREDLGEVVTTQKQVIAEKTQEVQELHRYFIEILSTAIEFRDCESGEHVQRIHDLTWILLWELRKKKVAGCSCFTDEQIEQIATASIMHDVGKIAIPDAILNKPGRLTPEEYEIMKQHTVLGSELLERISGGKDSDPIRIQKAKSDPVYRYAYEICRWHHEKWDGSGYPDHLVGEQIPIWAQIVALADCYDALTSHRVYKDAIPHQKAMQMILHGECGQFHPELLAAFAELQGEFHAVYEQ